MRRALPALTALALAGCDAAHWAGAAADTLTVGSPRTTHPAPAPALPLAEARQVGRLAARALSESSGLAPSRGQPGLFWSHNDSGNDAELFALDSTGAARGRVAVTGARNRDWEAVAAGPCPDGWCLYIGDVGDNGAGRDRVTVWRVAEPGAGAARTARATPIHFRYPDGPRDVEGIWVGPDTSLWLVTKRPLRRPDGSLRPALVYRLPAAAVIGAPAGAVAAGEPGGVLARLADSLPWVPLPRDDRSWISDAALSGPDSAGRRRLAIRAYDDVLVFEADSATGAPGALVARCSLRALAQRQGEGVAWLPDGRLLFSSEGRGAPLHAGRCPDQGVRVVDPARTTRFQGVRVVDPGSMIPAPEDARPPSAPAAALQAFQGVSRGQSR